MNKIVFWIFNKILLIYIYNNFNLIHRYYNLNIFSLNKWLFYEMYEYGQDYEDIKDLSYPKFYKILLIMIWKKTKNIKKDN